LIVAQLLGLIELVYLHRWILLGSALFLRSEQIPTEDRFLEEEIVEGGAFELVIPMSAELALGRKIARVKLFDGDLLICVIKLSVVAFVHAKFLRLVMRVQLHRI